jgi:hypothetical protein
VWSFALHSFLTALGEVEMPFFGASQKQKRREGEKERHSSQCRLAYFAGAVSVPWCW